MHHITRFAAGIILATLALVSAGPLSASASASAPRLGAAANFVVLGGAGVTCTDSTVTGNVGSKLTVTQTPTCHIAGAIHQGDATAVNAFNNFVTAYTALKAQPCEHDLTGQALGGLPPLAPGVYCFGSTADLSSGTLTLQGPSSGVWVFQVKDALTTATANVVMAGGGQACNVYWALGTAGTIGANTKFQGNILAGSAVTFTGANSSLVGRALAQTAVTMTGTTISGCGVAAGSGGDENGNQDHQDGNQDHQDGNQDHHDGNQDHEDGNQDHHDGNHDRGGHNRTD